jgi:DNA-directed RNA polymerase subunit M/transcription elongation factor TFIIS
MKPLHLLLLATTITASLASCSKQEESPETAPETSSETMTNMQATDDKTVQDMIAHGEEAHKVHCYKCHTDEVYTRENRFVKSIDALSKQVVRCKDGNDVPWFEEDTAAVVQFLNNKYYRF